MKKTILNLVFLSVVGALLIKASTLTYVFLAKNGIVSNKAAVVALAILVILSYAVSIIILQRTEAFNPKGLLMRSGILVLSISIFYSLYLLIFTNPAITEWVVTFGLLVISGIGVSLIYYLIIKPAT